MYTNYMTECADIHDINVSALSEEDIHWHFGYSVARGGGWAPMWALFGYYEPERYNWLVSALMWSYCLIGSVVLVNLLVAMFADTYNKISEEAENEYIYLRCTRLFEFKDSILPLPPVLNLPFIIRDTVMSLHNARQTLCYHTIRALFLKCRKGSKNGPSFSFPIPGAASRASPESLRGGNLQNSSTSGKQVGTPGEPSSARSRADYSLSKRRRRSLTARLPSNLAVHVGLLEKDLRQRRTPTIFDGKLLAQEYLKQVEMMEKDTVHALSRSLRSELQLGMKQRAEEFLAISTRVSNVEKQLEDNFGAIERSQKLIQESLKEIKAQLPGPPL
jgi:hypothetical protein